MYKRQVPYLENAFVAGDLSLLDSSNLIIMTIIVAIVVLMVVFFFGKTKKRIVPIYLSGENKGDDLTFRNSLKQPQAAALRNWYMESYFGERKMNLIGIISTVTVIGATLILIGGYTLFILLSMFGGVL